MREIQLEPGEKITAVERFAGKTIVFTERRTFFLLPLPWYKRAYLSVKRWFLEENDAGVL